MRTRIATSIVLLMAVSALPVSAHHNAAHTYDAEHPITLSGTVTAIQWRNPHVLVDVDAKQDDGTIVNWRVELVAALFFSRLAIAKDVLKAGDPITMTACVAKDGSRKAAARVVMVPSSLEGKRVGFCYAQ